MELVYETIFRIYYLSMAHNLLNTGSFFNASRFLIFNKIFILQFFLTSDISFCTEKNEYSIDRVIL